jgi:DNA-binding CsgD family transcriptional regulator
VGAAHAQPTGWKYCFSRIALELGIALATVAKHLEHVYRKLGVPNRTAAAALLDH